MLEQNLYLHSTHLRKEVVYERMSGFEIDLDRALKTLLLFHLIRKVAYAMYLFIRIRDELRLFINSGRTYNRCMWRNELNWIAAFFRSYLDETEPFCDVSTSIVVVQTSSFDLSLMALRFVKMVGWITTHWRPCDHSPELDSINLHTHSPIHSIDLLFWLMACFLQFLHPCVLARSSSLVVNTAREWREKKSGGW